MSRATAGLNPAQLAAVTSGPGPLLVLAGAGSGKTRVITHRIAWLIEQGTSPEEVLAVTFTNKAAGEMKERLASLLGASVARGVHAGTFHAFGLRVLKELGGRLGLPPRFSIVDAADQAALLRRLLRERRASRSVDVRDVARAISQAKRDLTPPEEYRSPGDPAGDLAAAVYGDYQRALGALGGVDFDDLIGLPVRLLTEADDVRAALRDRHRWMLVDEFQDTSPTQLRLVSELAGRGGNLTAVGDDDQSIYGWRGADSRNVLQFERFFPGARVLALEQNYRSTQAVLSAANTVIAGVAGRREKRLWTEATGGEPVVEVVCRDEQDEAEHVADDAGARRAEGRSWADFAVLYRTNAQARPFEEALRARRIPHHVVGGTRFFDRKEVRDVLAYLRLLHNPHDDLSLRRIINWPTRGLGPASVQALAAWATARTRSLWTALQQAGEVEGLTPKSRAACAGLVALVEPRRAAAASDPPAAAFDLVGAAGVPGAIRREARSPAEGLRRQRCLDDLLESLRAWVLSAREEGEDASLGAFLARVSLDGRDEEPEGSPGDRITLSSLHAAKGLEFPVVYLVGLEDGLLPFKREGRVRDEDEERRLTYVGMTRARVALVLTRARVRTRRGERRPRTPSRFLEGLGDTVGRRRRGTSENTEAAVEARRGRLFEAARRLLDE